MSDPTSPDLTTEAVTDSDGDGQPDTVHMRDEHGNEYTGHVADDGSVTVEGGPDGPVTVSPDGTVTGPGATPESTPAPAPAPEDASATEDLTAAENPQIAPDRAYEPNADSTAAEGLPPAPAQAPNTDENTSDPADREPAAAPTGAVRPESTDPAAPGGSAAEGEVTIDSTVDVDRDGDADVARGDVDGTPITAYLDSEGNAILVEADTDHNGTFETAMYAGDNSTVIAEVDTDDDGIPDLAAQYTDDGDLYRVATLDAEGQVTSVSTDVNLDGTPDEVLIDTDNDGTLDSTVLDVDGDAIPDTVLTDHDGDGTTDEISYVYGGPDNLEAPGGPTDPGYADDASF
ncbi:hypothetical protein VZC37_07650 [Gordonia sp. LSe1-13]|uniref:Uncharacterized protein n=1 Tax=Gordonia sesuvii TaxID=3116777 RepID=A0ABU7MAS4_9ACTN|nr:hypothetical protein [Gordonia sp. LSe1-13]